VCVRTCVRIYLYISIYMYIYVYIHTHTHTHELVSHLQVVEFATVEQASALFYRVSTDFARAWDADFQVPLSLWGYNPM